MTSFNRSSSHINESLSINDFNLTNIQEPVKDIFKLLTKAIQTQSLNIEALDQKLNSSYTKNEDIHEILEKITMKCSDEIEISSNQVVSDVENRLNMVCN